MDIGTDYLIMNAHDLGAKVSQMFSIEPNSLAVQIANDVVREAPQFTPIEFATLFTELLQEQVD